MRIIYVFILTCVRTTLAKVLNNGDQILSKYCRSPQDRCENVDLTTFGQYLLSAFITLFFSKIAVTDNCVDC